MGYQRTRTYELSERSLDLVVAYLRAALDNKNIDIRRMAMEHECTSLDVEDVIDGLEALSNENCEEIILKDR